MKLCNHPNVLRCYCCFCVQDQLWIISPFMAKGSLLRILQYLKKNGHIAQDEGLEVGGTSGWIVSNRKISSRPL